MTYSFAIEYVATTRVMLTAQTLFDQLRLKSTTFCVNTDAAPRPSIAMTASFFFVSIFMLITIGIGRMRMAMSAITSVYYVRGQSQ